MSWRSVTDSLKLRSKRCKSPTRCKSDRCSYNLLMWPSSCRRPPRRTTLRSKRSMNSSSTRALSALASSKSPICVAKTWTSSRLLSLKFIDRAASLPSSSVSPTSKSTTAVVRFMKVLTGMTRPTATCCLQKTSLGWTSMSQRMKKSQRQTRDLQTWQSVKNAKAWQVRWLN